MSVDTELSLRDGAVIVVLWTIVFSVSDILSPILLSNVVLSGFAGGVSFVLSLFYLRMASH